jgi:hypothetical protein
MGGQSDGIIGGAADVWGFAESVTWGDPWLRRVSRFIESSCATGRFGTL